MAMNEADRNKLAGRYRLSTRSLNIIEDAGGIKALLAHYQNHRSFDNIPRAGKKSNRELKCFFESLIKNGLSSVRNIILKEKIAVRSNNAARTKDFVEGYIRLKKNLSKRAGNVLCRLEKENEFDLNADSKTDFVKRLFIEDFDFKKLQNIGAKTISEFIGLRKGIKAIAYKNTFNGEVIEQSNHVKRIYLEVKGMLPKEEIEAVLNEKRYNLLKLVSIYILNMGWDEAEKELINLCYFTEHYQDTNALAKKLKRPTSELITLKSKVNQRIGSSVVHKIMAAFKEFPSGLPSVYDDNIIEFDRIASFCFNGITYTPNRLWSNQIYNALLGTDFIHINDAVFGVGKTIKSLVRQDICVFISRRFIETTQFNDLILWIDANGSHIPGKHDEALAMNLIELFYRQNKTELPESSLNDLNNIIEKVRRKDWKNVSKELARRMRWRHKRTIAVHLVYEFIKTRNETQKMTIILNHLKSHNVKFNTHALSLLLIQNKNLFVRLVIGNWGLREWQHTHNIEGSLRDIVYKKLESSPVPLHISELLDFLNKFHRVSENSLCTNLKIDNYNRFVFFNCRYLGLSTKKYDKSWYHLPEKALQYYLREKNLRTEREIIAYYTRQGFPEKHILYLLSLKKKSKKTAL